MMKKIFSLLLAGTLLFLCACNGQTADPTVDTTEPSATEPTQSYTPVEGISVPWEQPEAQKPDFSHVDEMTPDADGVYQIHTAAGVANLANHPDGKFRLLWDVDMEGAAWTPIAQFTGTLDGGGYTISNFTVEASENTGFVGVNQGTVTDLHLADVSITASEGYVGGLAGQNEGTISGCSVSGTMKVSGAAVAGGLVGKAAAGTLDSCQAGLRIEADASATVGLLGGQLQNVTLTACVYSGPMNRKDGSLFTNLAGTEENVTYTDCLWRDNTGSDEFLSQEARQIRDQVEQKMRAMGTVKWIPTENLMYIHPSNTAGSQLYVGGMTYHGLPYTNNFGSYERFTYSLNEDGTVQQFILDMGTQGADIFDIYMGNDCSGAVYWAWTQISNTTEWAATSQMIPNQGLGTVAVGTYDCADLADTMQILQHNGQQVIAESYTQLHEGDAIVTYFNDPEDPEHHLNHTRLIVEAPAVFRDPEGKLDVDESYVIIHGQGDGLSEAYPSTWEIDQKYTFRQLLDDQYIAISCQELVSAQVPACVVTVDNTGTGKAYMTTGTVTSNYRLISTTITITDSTGSAVFEKTLFTAVGKFGDAQVADPMRQTIRTYDLAAFAAYIRDAELTPGQTYTYELSAMPSTGETVILKTFQIQG